MSSSRIYVIYDDLSSDNEDTLTSWTVLAAAEYISQYPNSHTGMIFYHVRKVLNGNEAKCPDMFV